jgi:hypothetical protein
MLHVSVLKDHQEDNKINDLKHTQIFMSQISHYLHADLLTFEIMYFTA